MNDLVGSTRLDTSAFKEKIRAEKSAVEAEIQRREKQKAQANPNLLAE